MAASSSIPLLFPDYTLFPIPSDHFSDELLPGINAIGGNCNTGSAGALLWGEGEESLVSLFDDIGLGLHHHHHHHHHQNQNLSSSEYSSQTQLSPSSTVVTTTTPINYPANHQADDMGRVLALPELNMGMCGGGNAAAAGCENIYVGYQPDHQSLLYDFGEDCFGLVPDLLNPVYHPVASENWEIQSSNNQASPAIEDQSNIKVSRYSEEVRKERILRYLKKRNQRNFNKTIKYACRKTLADRRIRVRGRFARNNELLCDPPEKNDTSSSDHKHTELYNDNLVVQEMKKDEEEWLQDISNLMYLPYV